MKINLEGLTWQVELADAHSPELMVNNEPCRGTTWCGHQRIYISNELTPDCALRVIDMRLRTRTFGALRSLFRKRMTKSTSAIS